MFISWEIVIKLFLIRGNVIVFDINIMYKYYVKSVVILFILGGDEF